MVQAADGAGLKLDYQRDVNIVIKNLEDAIASMTTTPKGGEKAYGNQKSKARHDLTLRSIKRGDPRRMWYWLDKAYTHLDKRPAHRCDIAEVEALAQAYYDALDAESAKEEVDDGLSIV